MAKGFDGAEFVKDIGILLGKSAAHGRELAALLDPDTSAPAVKETLQRPLLAAIAVPATPSGRNMAGEDLAVTAGWAHHGQGDAVMPGGR